MRFAWYARRDVHNLVDVPMLVENECASKRTGTSRRVSELDLV